MKKHKFITLALTLVLTAGVLTACGSSKESSSEQTGTEDVATETATDTATEETTVSEDSATVEESTDLLAQIQERGTLLVGTEGTYAPFTYHDETGELVGFDVEVARALAEKLGVEAEFVETNWDSCIAGLDAERYDVVMNQVGITEERLEKYDFSTPYTVTRAVLIVATDNSDLTSFEGLSGKKAAQSLTSNYASLSEGYGAEIVSTDGLFSKAIELVSTGRADATINDEVSFYDYLKQQPEAPIKIADTLDEASENAVLIRKGNDTFVTAINVALKELAEDGTLEEISNKYFGANVTE